MNILISYRGEILQCYKYNYVILFEYEPLKMESNFFLICILEFNSLRCILSSSGKLGTVELLIESVQINGL